MEIARDEFFHRIKRRVPALGVGFVSLLLLFLIPHRPFGIEGHQPPDQIDETTAKAIHNTFRIYSVLKFQAAHLPEALIWDIAEAIHEESDRHSLDPILVLAVINVESRFQPRAVSRRGARGLMQLRPFVANALAEEMKLYKWQGEKSLDDPILNIKLGVFYLSKLKTTFRDLRLALAAYQWGPTKVKNRLGQQEPVPMEYARKVLSSHRSFLIKGLQIPRVIPRSPGQHRGDLNA